MAAEIEKEFTKLLKGKKVDHVEWMADEEMKASMWYKRPMCICFTDGTSLVLQTDDEGNDGGAATLFPGKDGERTHLMYTKS